MKKLFLFLTLIVAIGVKAQTYKEVQSRVNQEITSLEQRLVEVKDRIYYLEVTLDKKIEAANLKGANTETLMKEKFFSVDDLVLLKKQKTDLEKSMGNLKEVKLAGINYRNETDFISDLPERMTRCEYTQRVRALMFKNSAEGGTVKTLPGLLVNFKEYKGEITTFYINRVGFPEFVPVVKTLNPLERLEVNLPIGTYVARVVSGSYNCVFGPFDVRPDKTVHIDGQETYWEVHKNQSNW